MWILRASLSVIALAVTAVVISQLPDIQRYLKIRNM
jgi:hypothetical protein